jgi:hypothetical protein
VGADPRPGSTVEAFPVSAWMVPTFLGIGAADNPGRGLWLVQRSCGLPGPWAASALLLSGPRGSRETPPGSGPPSRAPGGIVGVGYADPRGLPQPAQRVLVWRLTPDVRLQRRDDSHARPRTLRGTKQRDDLCEQLHHEV